MKQVMLRWVAAKICSSPIKVTIVPRGNALGAAWYLPEERQITTKEQLLMKWQLPWVAELSEKVNFGKISTYGP